MLTAGPDQSVFDVDDSACMANETSPSHAVFIHRKAIARQYRDMTDLAGVPTL
jgi:hypothetical protein